MKCSFGQSKYQGIYLLSPSFPILLHLAKKVLARVSSIPGMNVLRGLVQCLNAGFSGKVTYKVTNCNSVYEVRTR